MRTRSTRVRDQTTKKPDTKPPFTKTTKATKSKKTVKQKPSSNTPIKKFFKSGRIYSRASGSFLNDSTLSLASTKTSPTAKNSRKRPAKKFSDPYAIGEEDNKVIIKEPIPYIKQILENRAKEAKKKRIRPSSKSKPVPVPLNHMDSTLLHESPMMLSTPKFASTPVGESLPASKKPVDLPLSPPKPSSSSTLKESVNFDRIESKSDKETPFADLDQLEPINIFDEVQENIPPPAEAISSQFLDEFPVIRKSFQFTGKQKQQSHAHSSPHKKRQSSKQHQPMVSAEEMSKAADDTYENWLEKFNQEMKALNNFELSISKD